MSNPGIASTIKCYPLDLKHVPSQRTDIMRKTNAPTYFRSSCSIQSVYYALRKPAYLLVWSLYFMDVRIETETDISSSIEFPKSWSRIHKQKAGETRVTRQGNCYTKSKRKVRSALSDHCHCSVPFSEPKDVQTTGTSDNFTSGVYKRPSV